MHDTSDLTCARQRTERIALLNDAARQARDMRTQLLEPARLGAQLPPFQIGETGLQVAAHRNRHLGGGRGGLFGVGHDSGDRRRVENYGPHDLHCFARCARARIQRRARRRC